MNLLTIRCSVIQIPLRGNAVSRKEEVENYRKDCGCSFKNVLVLQKYHSLESRYFTKLLTVSFSVYNAVFEHFHLMFSNNFDWSLELSKMLI